MIGITLDGTRLVGPTGTLHSRIAVLAFLTGHTPAEAAALYNPLVFARLGYFSSFARERAELLRRYLAYRINLAPIFDSWVARGCFMHAPDAPRMGVMLDLARLVCTIVGETPDETALAAAEAAIGDPLARMPSHPLFADIARRLGLLPEGEFCPQQPPDGARHAYRPETFLDGSYDAFRRVPRATLHAAPGVTAGLASLGLPEVDAPLAAARAAAAAAAPDAQAFLTWHGTVLQIDAGSTLVIQRRLRPEAQDATDLLTPHAIRLDAQTRPMALLGGIAFSAGRHPGTVAMRRGGKYLSAEPGRMAVRFVRDHAGGWESFLPMTRQELGVLRTLMRGGWRVEGSGDRIPRAAVRLATGMQLLIGEHRCNLRAAHPRVLSEAGETLRIAIAAEATGDGTELVLVADPADQAADIGLDPPAERALPAQVGSPEAFRAELDARLDLPALDENVHPPLTVNNADLVWTLNRHDGSSQAGIGRLHSRLTLWRATDKTVLLARGLEGIVADEQGVWKDHAFLLAPERLANGTAASLLRGRPADIVDHPVCIFYNPNLQSYYHWIVEALPALHALTPFLPEGSGLLLPPSVAEFRAAGEIKFDHREALAALGFGNLSVIESEAEAVLARDAIWLNTYSLAEMPAALLRSFRDRAIALHPPPAKREGRLYLKRRNNRFVANDDAIEAYLRPQGFEPVYPEDLPQAQQIALFAAARIIVATHGAGLANLMFCRAGTRVLELSPDTEFRPNYWMIAEKLGLAYGVLPCPTVTGTFDGDLEVDLPRLRALIRVLRTMAVEETPRRVADPANVPRAGGPPAKGGPAKRGERRVVPRRPAA